MRKPSGRILCLPGKHGSLRDGYYAFGENAEGIFETFKN